jgi:putative hydrolase
VMDWRLFADWHTHTLYSDGQGTIADNARAARERGLREVAIADHAPNNLGVGVRHLEQTLAGMRREIREWNQSEPDLSVKLALEANLISRDGDLDVPKKVAGDLDFLIASLHPLVIPNNWRDGLTLFLPNLLQRMTRSRWRRLRNDNTKAMVEAVHRYPVSFVAHPGLWVDIDTRELAEACVQNDTALEINCRHAAALTGYVQAALPSGVDFVINTDAHLPADVGRQEAGIALARRLELPPEQIRNAEVIVR